MTPGYGTQRSLALDEVAGGVAAVFLALVVFPLSVAIVSAVVTTVLGAVVDETAPTQEEVVEEEPPLEVVETRFVRFGAPPDPRRMPDRYVPTAATAPPVAPEAAEVPLDALPVDPVTGEPGLRPPVDPAHQLTPEQRAAEARNDLLTRLGDSAAATAEFAEPRVREGDAEGITEGTAERGEADIYPGRLYAFFRRGWQAPSSIPDEELRTLRCRVRVTITEDARVGDFTISGSGNETFDASVRQRMAQAAGASLPPPPPEEAERYLGTTQTITFVGPRRN